MKRQNSGVAAIIAIILMILFFFAIIFAALNSPMKQLEILQQTNWPSGVFDPNSLTYVESLWQWWLILGVLFPCIIFGYQQAQRRKQGQDV